MPCIACCSQILSSTRSSCQCVCTYIVCVHVHVLYICNTEIDCIGSHEAAILGSSCSILIERVFLSVIMATSMDQCETKVDILKCEICNNKLLQPKTFQCFHSFCSKCVDGLSVISEDEVEKYSCPVCEQFTNKDKVRINYALNELCSAEKSPFDLQKKCIYEQTEKNLR